MGIQEQLVEVLGERAQCVGGSVIVYEDGANVELCVYDSALGMVKLTDAGRALLEGDAQDAAEAVTAVARAVKPKKAAKSATAEALAPETNPLAGLDAE